MSSQRLDKSRFVRVGFKAWHLIRTGRPGLLVSIPLYRCWSRLRGLDFDFVSIQDLALDPSYANYHKNGGGPLLCDLLKQLQIKDADAILDLGSGKGGAMATLARYPFHAVHGVEISSELVGIARKNLSKLNLPQCAVYHADAVAFSELDDYTYFFMFNPFPELVLKHALANIEVSLRRKPRRIRLIYINPVHEQTILARGIFEKILVYQPYDGYLIRVYSTRPADFYTEGPETPPRQEFRFSKREHA